MNSFRESLINPKKVVILLLTFVCVLSGFLNVALSADPPKVISYQGRLLNSNGVPVSDASLDMVFKIYDQQTVGTGVCRWSNSAADCSTSTVISVALTDGLFSETLGDIGAGYALLDTTLFQSYTNLYLEVTVEGEVLGPTRKQLTAVPFAYNSHSLGGHGASAFFLLGSNNTVTGVNDFSGSVFSGTSPLVFEGTSVDDYETTFAIVDPTLTDKTITFQDASGTVALLGDIPWTDGGTVVYVSTATDDIAIGGSTVAGSEFGFDVSTTTMSLGDGSSSNPIMSFKDITGGSAAIQYASDDFTFSGADLIHSPTAVYTSTPGTANFFESSSTVSAAAVGGAGAYVLQQMKSSITNTAIEGGGEMYAPYAFLGEAANSGTGTIESMVGISGVSTNTSTAVAAVGGSLLGVWGQATNSGAGSVVPLTAGLYGGTSSTAGTVTAAYGVWGNVGSGAGTITTAYAGDFLASAGATRYGVRASASGGTNNYAGYFFGAAVHVDSTSTPTTPGVSTGSGDLYIYDQLEVDGTNQTTGDIVDITSSAITTGSALNVLRPNSGTDYTGTDGLVVFKMEDTASTGNLLYLENSGTGAALNIKQLGDNVAMDVIATNTTDYIARFRNDGDSDSNLGIEIRACSTSNPGATCDYVSFKDGSGVSVGAIEGDASGGVTNASAGSDYAELFTGSLSSFAEGDVIGLDIFGNAVLASNADQMIGAYSIAPNTLGNWFDGWRDAGTHVPVALLGQVPVTVNTEGGAITAGDYITISSTTGEAMKATGVGYVLGQALESHASGTGTIEVFISPTWQAVGVLTDAGSMTLVSDDLTLGSVGEANATTQGMDSYGLMMRGSGWDGVSAQDVSLGFVTHVADASSYRLSIEDASSNELAFVSQDGDLAISGRLYPSDSGTLQTDKYIYYDGSTGLGGDFMRTNASGWGSGSYDFAEMFPVLGEIEAGEVVVFADNAEHIMRSTGVEYDDKIAGIVSTQPGFLAGDNIDGHIPVALAGRVPTYVSNENGVVEIGDPLTTSSVPGYAMKATEAGPVVGYAMETLNADKGLITVFVRPSYFDGSGQDISDNEVTQTASLQTLELSGSVNLNAGRLFSVGSIAGIGDTWSVSENGRFVTNDRYVQIVDSYRAEKVETYAVTSPHTVIELSGTVELSNGRANVDFALFDPNFASIISLTAGYRVLLTADSATGSLYATDRENSGFVIKDTKSSSGVSVDWLVIGYHKDYEPEEIDPADQEEIEEEVAEEVVIDPIEDPAEPSDDSLVEDPVDTSETEESGDESEGSVETGEATEGTDTQEEDDSATEEESESIVDDSEQVELLDPEIIEESEIVDEPEVEVIEDVDEIVVVEEVDEVPVEELPDPEPTQETVAVDDIVVVEEQDVQELITEGSEALPQDQE